MKQKGKSSVEIGLSSITGYLAGISSDTASLNQTVYNHFQTNLKNDKNFGVKSNSITKYQNLSTILLSEINFGIKDLVSISRQIQVAKTNPKNQVQTINTPGFDLSKLDKKTVQLVKELYTIISKYITKNTVTIFAQFIKSFKEFNIELNKFIKNEKSINLLKRFFQTVERKKMTTMMGMEKFGIGVAYIAAALIGVSFVKWDAVAKLITTITVLLGLLYLYNRIGRTFQGGVIGSWGMNVIKRALGGIKGATGFVILAVGIALIASALMLTNFIPWTGVVLFLGSIAGFIGIMWAATLGDGKNSAIGSIIKLGFSLAILVLAVSAFAGVDFTGLIKFAILLVMLGFAINFVNKMSSGRGSVLRGMGLLGGVKGSGLVGFAIGLVFMVLAIDAFAFISWFGAANLIIFLFALGAAMTFANRGGGKGFNSSGMFGFAMGLAILILCIDAMDEVSWVGAFKLLLFIGLLGIAMNKFLKVSPLTATFSKSAKGAMKSTKQTNPLLGIAFSMILFAIAMGIVSIIPINPINIIVLIGLMIASTYIFEKIKRIKLDQAIRAELVLNLVAIAIVFMGLAFALISWLPINFITLALFVAATYLVITKTIELTKMVKKPYDILKKFLSIALALVIMSVAFIVVGLLSPAVFIGIVAFIGVFKLLDKFILQKLQKGNYTKVAENAMAIGIGLLVLGAGIFVVGIVGLIALPGVLLFAICFKVIYNFVIKTINRLKPETQAKALINAIMITISLILLSLAVTIISIIPINITNILLFGATVIGFGLLLAGVGLLFVPILLGSIAVIVMSVSLLLLVGLLSLINLLSLNPESLEIFKNYVKDLCIFFAAISPIAIMAMFGAVFVTIVAVAGLVVMGLLWAISMITIEPLKLEQYKNGVKAVVEAFNQFSLLKVMQAGIATRALVKTILMGFVVTSILLALQFLNIDDSKLIAYKNGVKAVVEAFNQFGVLEVTKVAAKSIILLPILLLSLISAAVMKAISAIELKTGDMTNFGQNLEILLDIMVESINKSKGKLKDSKEGIEAMLKLTGVGKNLADMMIAFANGTYVEYEVKNGEIKPKKVKQINYGELSGSVSLAVGNLLEGLIKPLSIISSDSDTWNFGGKTIQNPFKGKGFFGRGKDAGVERITKIGTAFTPLIDIIQNLGNMELWKNQEFLDRFNTGLSTVMETCVNTMTKISLADFSKADQNVTKLGEMFAAFDKFKPDSMKKANESIHTFVVQMSDDGKWKKIASNISKTRKEVDDMITSINKLDIKKSGALEKNLKLMAEKNNAEQLRRTLDALRLLISDLNETEKENGKNLKKAADNLVEVNNGGGNTGASNFSLFGNNGTNQQSTQQTTQQPTQENASIDPNRVFKVEIVNNPGQAIPVNIENISEMNGGAISGTMNR
jgi:hypothetical protein